MALWLLCLEDTYASLKHLDAKKAILRRKANEDPGALYDSLETPTETMLSTFQCGQDKILLWIGEIQCVLSLVSINLPSNHYE